MILVVTNQAIHGSFSSTAYIILNRDPPKVITIHPQGPMLNPQPNPKPQTQTLNPKSFSEVPQKSFFLGRDCVVVALEACEDSCKAPGCQACGLVYRAEGVGIRL